jgi:DNA (cytosine-5)-methyltransferase 1
MIRRILRKERTEYGKAVRKKYEAGEFWDSRHNMTRWAIRPDELSNTLSTVLKDNLLVEIHGVDELDDFNENKPKEDDRLTTKHSFTYVSLFSGVGGFEQALNKLGGKCVMASEIDKWANLAYETLYGHKTVGDITKVKAEDVPDHDLLVGGFPCQAFSVAGKRLGFEDTRGTLFFEIARITKAKRPKAMLLENVKGLVSHDKGKTLDTIIQTLNGIGYTVDFEVLNSKYFGVPQNRERIFIIAIRDDLIAPEPWNIGKRTDVVAKGKRRISQLDGVKTFNFDWPPQTEVTTRLRDILEDNVDERYYLSEEKTAKLVAQLEHREKKVDEPIIYGNLNHYGNDQMNRVYSTEGISPTIMVVSGGGREQKIAEPHIEQFTRGDGVSCCIDANYTKGTAPGDVGKGRRTHVVEKEDSNVEEKERNTFEILRSLWEEVGEETFSEWRFRVLTTFQQTEILRPSLYGGSVQRSEEDRESELVYCTQMGERNKENEHLRTLRVNRECRHSPQRWKLAEQFARELGSIMQKLSLERTSYEEKMRDLWSTTQGSRLLQQALHQIQEIWRPQLHKVRYRIRKLTPREAFRLQGFPDSEFDKLVSAGISNSQLYKMAGNAVTVNVIEAIGERLIPLITEVDAE